MEIAVEQKFEGLQTFEINASKVASAGMSSLWKE